MNNSQPTIPNSPKELLEMNTKPPTMDDVIELWMKLSYEDKDNTVYHLLQKMRNFYTNMGSKEMEKDEPNWDWVGKCLFCKTTMENIITLHQQV